MKFTFTEEAIEAAVQFWVTALGGETPEHRQNVAVLGDHHGPAMVGLVETVRARSRPTPEKLEIFATELRKQLHEGERVYGVISADHVQLFNDYDPWGLLGVAAAAAGIPKFAFPMKTRVVLEGGRVTTGFPERVLYEPRKETP